MIRKECLDTASTITASDRQNDYGTPENNFQVIAELWSAYKRIDFTATDVAVLLALLKIARIKTSPQKEDNWVDLAGYAACGCEVSTCNRA